MKAWLSPEQDGVPPGPGEEALSGFRGALLLLDAGIDQVGAVGKIIVLS